METFTKLLFFPLHSPKVNVDKVVSSLHRIFSTLFIHEQPPARGGWQVNAEESCELTISFSIFSNCSCRRFTCDWKLFWLLNDDSSWRRANDENGKIQFSSVFFVFNWKVRFELCWKFAACDTARSTGWHVSFIKLVTFVLTGRTCAHGKVTTRRREWERDRTILIFIAEAAVSQCSMQAKSAGVVEGRRRKINVDPDKMHDWERKGSCHIPESVFLSNIHSFIPFIIHKVNFGWMLGTRHSSGLNSARELFFENIINFSFQNLPLSGIFVGFRWCCCRLFFAFFVRRAVEK